MDQSRLLEVGRIAKPHGLNGDVVVALDTDVTERLASGSVLSTDAGPLVVRSARRHQHRWIVEFEGVTDRAAADELRGTVLRAEPVTDDDALWVHELIGAEVRTVEGRSCGRVEAVEANPASALMVLPGGVLVPVAFIVDETDLPERVVIDPPEGLLDDEG